MLFNQPKYSRLFLGIIAFLVIVFFNLGFLPDVAQAKTESASSTSILGQTIQRITEFQLDNGLKFIVLEDRDAPVISFVTYADVGGVDEPDGKTGVAHFLEHLAFKGTTQIGTMNYTAEKKALEQLDEVYNQLKAAQAAQKTEEIKRLQEEFAKIQAEATQYVKRNEFGQIVETAGGSGLNAATSADSTIYFYSFPANKLELWMSLESERFLDPVFREFYKEKEVILEERRLRTDNNPIGRLSEAFIDTAFIKHPYKRPVIGYDEDIRNLERSDVQQFFDTYYPANNLTIVIAGDVDPNQVKQLAEIYFGRFPAKPKPNQVTVVEPQQIKTREITLKLPSQPWHLQGYHRPALDHRDNAIYEVIATIMSEGRTSRLYKSLVEEQQVALFAEGFNGFPEDKYPNLILFYAINAPNTSLDDLAQALNQEIERLKNEPVSEEELQRAKNQIRASLLRDLNSNMGMARALAKYEVKTGSWRNLFTELDAVAAVTAEDIQRVSQQTFTPENRTIGRIVPE